MGRGVEWKEYRMRKGREEGKMRERKKKESGKGKGKRRAEKGGEKVVALIFQQEAVHLCEAVTELDTCRCLWSVEAIFIL